MAFHEVRFPASLSFGAVGGPERRTEIVRLANGHEERSTPWAHALRRYDAGMGLRSVDDLEALVAFFEARGGQLHGFRWKDWSDWRSAPASRPLTHEDQLIGEGDGERRAFPLLKRYRSGDQTYLRPIAKPVAGSVRIGIGKEPRIEGVDYSVDPATGMVEFVQPPSIGAEVTAGFEFDVPVRFDTDRLQISMARFQAGEVPRVPVIEVRA